MASYEISLVDVVRTLDRLVTETKVADGDTAGLLGVILEISLDELVGVVTDDLRGVLVGTNGTVTAETPELALNRTLSRGDRSGLNLRKREIRNIIDDTDGETSLRSILGKFGVDREDRGRSGIFGTETVTAAGKDNVVQTCLAERGSNIEVERLTEGAGLLRSVENGNLLDGLGKNLKKSGGNPRTIQTNLDQTDLLACSGEVVDNFLGNVAYRTHCDDHAVCIGSAVVVEEIVIRTELLVDLLHVLLNNSGQCIVNRVAGLAVLEEHVVVLMGTAHSRMLRVQSVSTELRNGIHVAHFLEVSVVPELNLLDLMGGTETVEEVEERNLALDCCEMSNGGEIHNFLRVGLRHHGETGLTARIHVAVVTEDVQGLRSNATCGYIENTRELLGSNLVHIRDHQKKTLRCGKCGGDSTGSKGTVNGTCSAGFGLHLGNFNRVAEDVLAAFRRPLVDGIGHRAGRGDGVNTGNFRKRIGYVSGSGIAIHGLFHSSHCSASSFIRGFCF